ncbi:hypothetical protein, partial [Pseudomonas aeruginosa]
QGASAPGAIALNVQLDTADPAANVEALPSFHAAAVELDEPDDGAAPRQTQALAGLSTRRLTLATLDDSRRAHALSSGAGEAQPLAAT